MCQLVLFITSQEDQVDAWRDTKLYKRGDVIDAFDDSVVLSDTVLSHAEWRVLRWPGVPQVEAQPLLSPEWPTEESLLPEVPDPMLQRRGFYLNLDHPALPPELVAQLTYTGIPCDVLIMPPDLTIAQLTRQRPKRPNPHVIG